MRNFGEDHEKRVMRACLGMNTEMMVGGLVELTVGAMKNDQLR